jgi:hypothetical protein
MPSVRSEPGEHRSRALEHPSLGFNSEDAGEQPVVGELALQIAELDAALAREWTQAIGDSVAHGTRIAVWISAHRL